MFSTFIKIVGIIQVYAHTVLRAWDSSKFFSVRRKEIVSETKIVRWFAFENSSCLNVSQTIRKLLSPSGSEH